jgi:hypothetical protein
MSEPQFFDWYGVVAIGTSLTLVGHMLDWFLRRTSREAVLASLRRLEDKLAKTQVTSWQLLVAASAVRAWHSLGHVFRRIYFFGQSWFESPVDLNQVTARTLFGRVLKEQCLLLASLLRRILGMLYAGVVSLLCLLLVWAVVAATSGTDAQVDAALLTCATVVAMPFGAQVLILTVLAQLDEEVIWPASYKNRPLILLVRRISTVCVTSVYPLIALSGIATAFAVTWGMRLAPDSAGSGNWFLESWHSWLIGPLNILPTITTALISYWLLSTMVRTRSHLLTLTLVDVAGSSVLAILTHSVLAALSSEESRPILSRIAQSAEWFGKALSMRLDAADSLTRFAPVIFTAFLPVATYSAIVLFLGLIVSPGLKAAGYIAGAMGEKDETPFKQLAVFGALILALGRVLAEWPYFRALINSFGRV